MDSLGRCGESCILTLLRVRFAWQVWGMVAIGVAARVLLRDRRGESRTRLSRGRRGEWCDLLRGRASFCVAGAGNRARQVKPQDFVALCDKSRACV